MDMSTLERIGFWVMMFLLGCYMLSRALYL